MAVWLGQLVIAKGTRKPSFKVQYWRTPSTTPAFLGFETAEDLRRYLKHCRLSAMTPDQVIEQLRHAPRVMLNTIESEEAAG